MALHAALRWGAAAAAAICRTVFLSSGLLACCDQLQLVCSVWLRVSTGLEQTDRKHAGVAVVCSLRAAIDLQ